MRNWTDRVSRSAAVAALMATALLVGCGSSAAPGSGAPPAATTAAGAGAGTNGTSAGAATTPAPTMAPTTTPTSVAAAAADMVTVAEFAFSPANVSVKAGTKVSWTNRDEFAHSVLVQGGAIPEARMDAGASTSITFTTAGTYAYVCGIHNSMTGTVVVTA